MGLTELISHLKTIGYHSGNLLEVEVESLLKKLKITYVSQPNGSQKFPDFYISDFNLNLECKSVANSKPMWNCSYPKQTALYVIACKKFKNCLVKYGSEIITEEVCEIYKEYASKHKELERDINDKLSKINNPLNFKVFARNMYVQGTSFNENLSNIEIETEKYTTKKGTGQYFTTSNDILSKLLDDYPRDINKSVLEPSCGLGHLLNLVTDYKDITAIDNDLDVLDISKKLFPDANYIHKDFLEYVPSRKFDLIIGNPPYFEMKKEVIPEDYLSIASGRCNIYYLFIYKCINLLEEGGDLRLIIPSSFLSNSYAEACRKYLLERCDIIDIIQFNATHFENAIQNVIILKCRRTKNPNNQKFTIGSLITSSNIKDCEVTIKSLGCYIKTGNIVWNKHKEFLSDTVGLKLWYSSCINGNYIQTNLQKKPLLAVNSETQNKIIKTPCILVQRIVKDRIVYKFIEHSNFFVENHVNIIFGPSETLRKICKSFEDPRTNQFISQVFKNNHLSKSQLENILPVF